MQLFCFTYAGGTAKFYDQLEKIISPNIEVVKFDYSGHGSRYKEPFSLDFNEVADDFYNRIINKLHKRETYALFGYSMGTIALVEVLRRILDDETLPYPKNVFLAAHEPHTKVELENYKNDELDDYIKQRTLKFGGIPQKLVNNESFWRMYLPIYRNDYSMIKKYDFNKLNLKTTIPLIVFYSETDTPYEEICKWAEFFVGDVNFYCYDGNHFFMLNHYVEIGKIIEEKLRF